jgi:protein pelota
MKIIYKNIKKGIVKVKIENLDDLWYLSYIIDKGDLVKGQTQRKIKVGADKSKQIKKTIFLKIRLEDVEFHKYSDILRMSGIIEEGPDDIPRGSHHTINAEINSMITIEKEKFLNYQLEKLKEASNVKMPKILICVMDREDAFFALLKTYGYELLSKIEGDVQKKRIQENKKSSFYPEIIKIMEEYDKRYTLDNIILASPAFFKEDLMKEIKNPELKKKIVLATCSSLKEDAINEVLKRQEIQEVLKKDRISKEVNLVENLLKEISKGELAAYSLKEVKKATEAGAVSEFLITDSLIRKTRQANNFDEIDTMMKLVEQNKGKIHIISSEHEAGKKLDGLGGIGAILRYKLSY